MTVAEVLQRLDAQRDLMPEPAGPGVHERATGDVRDGAVYLMDDPLLLAVKVAVATGRPLLLTGDPGTGKSSLAAWLAARLDWRYYEHVVTGRTEANDLLWQFDTVRKLGDASGHGKLADSDYVQPGVLWWAVDREGARRRGAGLQRGTQADAAEAGRDVQAAAAGCSEAAEPQADLNATRSPHHAVVLIDEIDKADPDVPNALLVPLGSGQFTVRETQAVVAPSAAELTSKRGRTARGKAPGQQAAPNMLVVITSNGERVLPPAFLRRCVVHHLDAPDPARLEAIAAAHARLEGRKPDRKELARVKQLAQQSVQLREEFARADRKGSGTAEFLDAVRASRELAIGPDQQEHWDQLVSLTLRKGAARP
jgi:MoxR-like ATPase